MKRVVTCALWMLLPLLAALSPAYSQSFMSEAESHGCTLKKVVSDTTIATGVPFSYTIYFSVPPGANGITITDNLPPALEFISISVNSPCGPPTVTSPTAGSMGGVVTLTWNALPSGCSGSFTMVVKFPNGITCNNAGARNRVCMSGKLPSVNVDFCTGSVSTIAIAASPWQLQKAVLNTAWVGGACPNATANEEVQYQLCVSKTVGTTGQLNLENAVVTDVLPTGATLVPGSPSCATMTQTGNTITWTVGSLSALTAYTTQCCTFRVLYPRAQFPYGSSVTNRATLTGLLGPPPPNSCGPDTATSNTTCVQFISDTSASINKWVYTTRQPGCAGEYVIRICNNGTTPIPSFTAIDVLPPALVASATLGTMSTGLTAILNSGVITITSTAALPVGACRYVYVNFVIPPSAAVGDTIRNCVTLTITGQPPAEACAQFVVAAPLPKPCLWKAVCSPQSSYAPGQVVRIRLRLQNVGGQQINAGSTIVDVLDPNLEYVGSPSYYTATSWNAPCQSTSNWTGVSVAVSGNTLTFTLPSIPAACQNTFWSNCGMYGTGGIPYEFIEFDARIRDTCALGNIPNVFSISGANLTSTTVSNTVNLLVAGTAGFLIDKMISKDTTNWVPALTVAAGSNVNCRLRFTVASGSVGLRNITFADLLPRDASPGDSHILGPCGNRGSQFDLRWLAALPTQAPLAVGWNNNAASGMLANVNNFSPAGIGGMFPGSCGSNGAWSAGLAANMMNLGYYFGPQPISAGNSALAEFTVGVPATAVYPESACNTFAANAVVRHRINGGLLSDQSIGALESLIACVSIDSTSRGTICGWKFNDLDGDGVRDSGEPGLPGWTISAFLDGDTLSVTTNTDANGHYCLESLPQGSWIVTEGHVAGWTQTMPGAPGTYIVTVRNGDLLNLTFGNKKDSTCLEIPEQCRVDSIRINTGYDHAAQAAYAVHTPDSYWTVEQEPGSGTVPHPAWTIPKYPTGWHTPLGVSQWLSAYNHTDLDINNPEPDTPYRFRYKFCVCEDVDSVRIVGNWLADNIACMYLDNPIPANQISCITSAGGSSFSTPHPFAITMALPTPGTDHYIYVDLRNLSGVAMGFNIEGSITPIGLQPRLAEDPACCHSGAKIIVRKINDLNENGINDNTADAGSIEPGLPNWTIILNTVPPGTPITLQTDANGYCSFFDIAPGTYTVSEGPSTGWTQSIPGTGSYTVTLVNNQTVSLVFGNYTSGCDIIDSTSLDPRCCEYSFRIVNLLGSPITSISYVVSGAIVDEFTTTPGSHTVPFSFPQAHGSTSGILFMNVPTPATQPIHGALALTPTSATGFFTVQMVVHHGQTDSCIVAIQDTCAPAPRVQCDTLLIIPFPQDYQLSGRKFTVLNRKIPASPICYIKIDVTPIPVSGWQGMQLYSDLFPQTPWLPDGLGRYTRAPKTASLTPPAMNSVSFVLGIDYNIGWSGDVRITTYHCDGDSCVDTYTNWRAVRTQGGGGRIAFESPKYDLFAQRMRIDNSSGSTAVKWVGVSPVDSSDLIFAMSAQSMDEGTVEKGAAVLEGGLQSKSVSLYTLKDLIPIGKTSDLFNIVLARQKGLTRVPVLRWTMYDANGNAVSSDTASITTSVKSVGSTTLPNDFDLLESFPNPSIGTVTINYLLAKRLTIRLDLYDAIGTHVGALYEGEKDAGLQSVTCSTSNLATGTYYIRLSSGGKYISMPLMVVK